MYAVEKNIPLLSIIKKNVLVHLLRHNRYVQELLGHKTSKTAEVYTHVSNKELNKIKNPLNSLQIKE